MGNLDDALDVVEFLMRLLSDPLPGSADLIYLVSETVDNENSVLHKGLTLHNRGIGRSIAIFGIEAGFGFPGCSAWCKVLSHMGHCREVTLIPSVTAGNQNTFVEAQSLVSYLKHEGLDSVVIVAPAFHLPRAFISLVSVAKKEYPDLKIYPQVGDGLPWDRNVVHSQGITKGSRLSILEGELRRLQLYHEKGDLVPWQEALRYLQERDQKS